MKCSVIHVSFRSLSEHYFHQFFRLVFHVNRGTEKKVPKIPNICKVSSYVMHVYLYLFSFYSHDMGDGRWKCKMHWWNVLNVILHKFFMRCFTSGTTTIIFHHNFDLFHFRSAQACVNYTLYTYRILLVLNLTNFGKYLKFRKPFSYYAFNGILCHFKMLREEEKNPTLFSYLRLFTHANRHSNMW